ncbi:Hypothetical predicted protein [Marmota monax]|uniref:Uncharacterized protein n=1 Tax=Marmota monax TaxID=9995 RepID=A0A5E4AXY0_MARMO|nr:hypothetical protein GHT09_015872 [Marmota monax]VTJ62353.1 Hypothetical predicted protein [Marmota monax]
MAGRWANGGPGRTQAPPHPNTRLASSAHIRLTPSLGPKEPHLDQTAGQTRHWLYHPGTRQPRTPEREPPGDQRREAAGSPGSRTKEKQIYGEERA